MQEKQCNHPLNLNDYYIARANWEGTDQSERFIKNNIWEDGYKKSGDAKFEQRIRKLKEGDILILAVPTNTISCIGTVIEPTKNGYSVKVKWFKNFNRFSTDAIQYGYMDTIQKILSDKDKLKKYCRL